MAAQILAEAEAVDAAEDELYGDVRGDELPPELADPVTRKDRIRKALAELEAERAAAEARRGAQARACGAGATPRPPRRASAYGGSGMPSRQQAGGVMEAASHR